jgi:hypothetical protein
LLARARPQEGRTTLDINIPQSTLHDAFAAARGSVEMLAPRATTAGTGHDFVRFSRAAESVPCVGRLQGHTVEILHVLAPA